MTDVFSKKKRSEVMSCIKCKDTKPEKFVRSLLHKMGYRFRKNRADLPGKPDIVLTRYKTVIFVHGCFWHRHAGCRFTYTPKSREKFWTKKFESNILHDKIVRKELRKSGWKSIIAWECEIQFPIKLAKKLQSSLNRSFL
jgi:DNA mismatch endonuclease, patch repair protein